MKLTSIIAVPDQDPSVSGDGSQLFEMVRRLKVPVWVFDIDRSQVAFANETACALWGSETEEELCARDMSEGMSSTVKKRLKQYQSDFENSDATFTELWTLYPNGEPRSVRVIFKGFRFSDGRMGMQCEAIEESSDEPENLRSAEAVLHTDVMITLFSQGGPALYQNPAARNVFPAETERFSELFEDQEDFALLMEQVEFSGEHRLVTRLKTSSGAKWIDLSVKSCSDAATGKPAHLLTAIDVTELKEARDTARYLADRDQLTNLHNRSYLQSYLDELEHRRLGGSCAVVFFDIDRFKQINDRYGHDVGDSVLRQIAIRTRSALRPEDLVSRLGGDEFVVVIEDVPDRAGLDSCITRLRAAISKPIQCGELRIDVTISVGVAVFSPRFADYGAVLREADIALYASKQAGRDCVTYFNEEMGEAVKARDRVERELKRAVVERQFVLHYQPRLDLKTGQVVAVEGLVRWNHPTRGIVMPNDFIPICEETGLIEDLGRLVLEIGCEQARTWHEQGLDLMVSLNVSPRQFADATLLDTLAEISSAPDFPTGWVELELTENVLIGDNSLIAERLRSITHMGYRIAIDDFGTGYSNLSYISRFPLTCLKIDRTFIDQLPESGPIVRLILTLAQEIGARVVSEGVETKAQYDWLAEHDCNEVQGFYVTPAMPACEVAAFARSPFCKGAGGAI